MNMLKRLVRDEEGASLVEYTILLGIITVAVIVTVGLVGDWVSGQWVALEAELQKHPVPGGADPAP
jgi:pilus assembly protein Flp/PilA